MDPFIGLELGNYKLVELLGKGTFGRVYRGAHLYLPKQAAIKILRVELSSQEAVADFWKEARDLAQLKHRHIVQVLDFAFYDQMTPYFVMPLTLGSLEKKSSRGATLDMKTILSYVRGASQALQYAHYTAKVVHRDIKPANLLVGEDGEVLVSDFGLAVIAHSINSLTPQEPLGSPAYMAPEQWDGEAIPASDQYALAICVYQWLLGDVPFRGPSIVKQHKQLTPPSLVHPGSTVSAEIEKVVMRALAKDSKKRFASVQDFAFALEQASQITEQSRSSRPISPLFSGPVTIDPPNLPPIQPPPSRTISKPSSPLVQANFVPAPNSSPIPNTPAIASSQVHPSSFTGQSHLKVKRRGLGEDSLHSSRL